MSAPRDPAKNVRSRRRIAWAAAAMAFVMVGASFAAVPLYKLFCQATGFAGTTQVAKRAPGVILARTVEVRFDANHAPGLGIDFKPQQTSMRVRLGETGLAFYSVTNKTDKPIVATAAYNVSPDLTGQYFVKLECFCFREQTFEPGKTVDLPVVFFVAPEFADDRDTRDLHAITLSYTFFAGKEPKLRTAALGPP